GAARRDASRLARVRAARARRRVPLSLRQSHSARARPGLERRCDRARAAHRSLRVGRRACGRGAARARPAARRAPRQPRGRAAGPTGPQFGPRLPELSRAAGAPRLGALRDPLPSGALGVTLSGSGPSVVVWAEPQLAAQVLDEVRERAPEAKVAILAVAD